MLKTVLFVVKLVGVMAFDKLSLRQCFLTVIFGNGMCEVTGFTQCEATKKRTSSDSLESITIVVKYLKAETFFFLRVKMYASLKKNKVTLGLAMVTQQKTNFHDFIFVYYPVTLYKYFLRFKDGSGWHIWTKKNLELVFLNRNINSVSFSLQAD